MLVEPGHRRHCGIDQGPEWVRRTFSGFPIRASDYGKGVHLFGLSFSTLQRIRRWQYALIRREMADTILAVNLSTA